MSLDIFRAGAFSSILLLHVQVCLLATVLYCISVNKKKQDETDFHRVELI